MNKPLAVKYAERAVWTDLALYALLALIQHQTTAMTSGTLAVTLLLYLGYGGILYKIGQRANWARYTYLALTVFSVASLALGGMAMMTRLELGALIATTPLTVLSVYWLLKKESSDWFGGWRKAA